MDISTHFDQEALSDVILHVRSTSDDHARIDPDSRKRPRPEDEPSSERSFHMHKIILFQSPYFEKLHGWKAGCAGSAAAPASSGPPAPPPPTGTAEEQDQVSAGPRVLTPPSGEPHSPPPGAAEEQGQASSGPHLPLPSEDALAELHVGPLPGKAAEPLEPAAAPSASCAALPTVCAACAARAEQVVLAGAACSACAARAVELVLHVEECDLEAVELLLKCLYKVELSEEARGNGQLLLQVYCLEDKYKIPAACMEPVLAALSAFQAKDIDLALLLHVYSLPDQLLEAASLLEIAAVCKQKLLLLFGDVPAMIIDAELRQQFCALPYAAVLAWLRSDDLKVHSESCVLLLLTAWVRSEDNSACSPEQLEQLAHSVRVKHLSATYLHGVLPDLKWFQDCCSEDARFLSALNMETATGRRCFGWTGPASWIAVQRSGTAMPESAIIAWDLGSDELEGLDAAADAGLYSPTGAYLNGVFFGLVLRTEEAEEEVEGVDVEGITLGMYLAVNTVKMNRILGCWGKDKIFCLFKAELWGGGEFGLGLDDLESHAQFGSHDILHRSGATIAELVAPSLVEGRLHLKAVITAA